MRHKRICLYNSFMIKLILTGVFIFISLAANALDSASFTVGSITAKNWKLDGVKFALTDIAQHPQKLVLTIDKLTLPKPFNDIKLVHIRCSSFTWQNNKLSCEQGHAQIHSKYWQSPAANFSFYVEKNHSSLKLTELQLAGGTWIVEGEEIGDNWQLQINARAVEGRLLQKLSQQTLFAIKDGKVSLALKASGSHALIKDFSLTAELDGLTGQTKDGRFATEALTAVTALNAQNNAGIWQWRHHSHLNGGAIYSEPLYLESKGQAIGWDAQGDWNNETRHATITSANYRHSLAVELSGNAVVQYKNGLNIEKAGGALRSHDLQSLSSVYLKPFFEQTVLEGVSLTGDLQADFSIVNQALTSLSATVNHFGIHDAAERIKVLGGAGTINWSDNALFNKPSRFSWRQLHVHALPVGPSHLLFLSRANHFKLLEKTRLPFSGGIITINQLGWQLKLQQGPEVYFEAGMSNVSLQQLSAALKWKPLSGNISGHIPRVNYKNDTLGVDGEININVFDGTVKITQLAASGLFTDIPKFHSEIEIDNLDLEQLTGKFEFGGITGKLSGFVRELTLENWRPVTFFAWLGTPDDDDSTHRISQKAVRNIASIGGGGAADLLSRSFLSLFETFGYDKLGLGCYLHEGVCQLMGVEATASGYAIITGGGLPRIDVIGYNPRVDWDVLMERLSRITASDEVIIE